jgi:hypothetical protein
MMDVFYLKIPLEGKTEEEAFNYAMTLRCDQTGRLKEFRGRENIVKERVIAQNVKWELVRMLVGLSPATSEAATVEYFLNLSRKRYYLREYPQTPVAIELVKTDGMYEFILRSLV